jgi:N utilization substance protein A
VAELGGEKIDVIEWSEDASTFVAKALSPAQVIEVRIDEEHRIANVVVPERMLSLAIGREGQNARLAAKLTGWRIDIRSDVSVAEAAKAEAVSKTAAAEELLEAVEGLEAVDALETLEIEAVEVIAESDEVAAEEVSPAPKPKRRKAVARTEKIEPAVEPAVTEEVPS